MALKIKQLYSFGEFRLDAHAKVLLRGHEPVRLTRKAVETLLALVQHAEQVLTKDELIATIWEGRVVDEANLQQNIAVVRKALAARPGEPGFIETFPGRGYRIIGPILVEHAEAEPEPLAPHPIVEAPSIPAPVAILPRRNSLRWTLVALLIIAATGGIVAALRTRTASTTRLPIHRTAVAKLDGRELQGAISPNGQDVAFILARTENRPAQLWVHLKERPQPFNLPAGEWDYASPAWSPDGFMLAYMRFGAKTGELLIASRDGSGERVIGNVYPNRRGLYYHHVAWSPDGRSLVIDDLDESHTSFSLFLISVASGERKRLTDAPAHFVGDVEPRYSPDGREISFVRVSHRTSQSLMVIRTDGSGLRQLTRDGIQVTSQDWLPASNLLVFASNQSGEFRLWRVAANRSEKDAALDPSDIYAEDPLQIAIARAAPVLLYSVLRQDFNIWRLSLRPDDRVAERWTEVINSTAQDASPQYSPDGSRICFRSDRSGEEQLWVSNADGSHPQQITSDRLNPSVGRWSPGGHSIVFNDSRRKDLYIVAENGSGKWSVRALGLTGVHPVYSTDGQWIYSGRNDSQNQSIFKLPVNGGPPTTISNAHGMSFGTSATGRDLYFVKELPDSTLWKMSLASGEISQVLDGLVPYCTSCWAESAGGIYYLGTDSSTIVRQAIFFHSFQGGPDRRIVAYPEPLVPLGSGPFSLSPDGRNLLCVRVDSSRADLMRAEPYR